MSVFLGVFFFFLTSIDSNLGGHKSDRHSGIPYLCDGMTIHFLDITTLDGAFFFGQFFFTTFFVFFFLLRKKTLSRGNDSFLCKTTHIYTRLF
jgi:hypothetical protein